MKFGDYKKEIEKWQKKNYLYYNTKLKYVNLVDQMFIITSPTELKNYSNINSVVDSQAIGVYRLKFGGKKLEVQPLGRLIYKKTDNNAIYIKFINVNENHFRQGIGSAMLEVLEDIAYKNKVDYIYGYALARNEMTLEDLSKFYEKNGYKMSNKDFKKEQKDFRHEKEEDESLVM